MNISYKTRKEENRKINERKMFEGRENDKQLWNTIIKKLS